MHIFDEFLLNFAQKKTKTIYILLLFLCFTFESRLTRIFFLFNFCIYLFEHTLFPFFAFLGDIYFEIKLINTFLFDLISYFQ